MNLSLPAPTVRLNAPRSAHAVMTRYQPVFKEDGLSHFSKPADNAASKTRSIGNYHPNTRSLIFPELAFLPSLFYKFLSLFRHAVSQSRLERQEQIRLSEACASETTEPSSVLLPPYKLRLYTPKGNTSKLSAAQAAQRLKNARLVAVGDLHASYRKLLETLVVAGLVKMPPETATRFVELANDRRNAIPAGSAPDAESQVGLYAELKKLTPSITWTGGNRQLLLIGDVLADRGPFDNITLDLIERLSQGHPERFIRLASSHDHEALFRLGGEEMIHPEQSTSMSDAYRIAERNQTTIPLQNSYKNYLLQSKLMHYNPKNQVLYTHAPIDDKNIKALIRLMRNKGYSAPDFEHIKTPEQIARFAEQANAFYRDYVNHVANVSRRMDYEVESVLSRSGGFLWSRKNNPFYYQTPFKNKGVSLLVHGHNGGSAPNTVNLDQHIRKGFDKKDDESLKDQISPLFYLE